MLFHPVIPSPPWPFDSQSRFFSQSRGGATADSSCDGTVGGDILRRFKRIVGYSRRQLILEPDADLEAPLEYDISGISLIAKGDDLQDLQNHSHSR